MQSKITLGFGAQVQSPIAGEAKDDLNNTVSLDLRDLKLDRAPYRRSILKNQLYSGYLRLDMCEPLLKGNLIVLKGDKLASGKDLVVESSIKHFLKESDDHRVIHVSLNAVRADQIWKVVAGLSEDEKARLAVICADEYTSGDCEQYLAPIVALKFAQKLRSMSGPG